jgi:asparagine synthase (glutamine-hydrolysing)
LCGICGIWFFDSAEKNGPHISAMNHSLRHRGPDDEGYYHDDTRNLQLGHRRLSVMDLSEAARQPMKSSSGNTILVYNGEVYNFPELKNTLSAKGYSFITNSDAEVIVNAWEYWGEECFNQFNGMWALALWNGSKKELTLSRDRFGVKPLYYIYQPGNFFAFASETIAFKQLSFFNRAVSEKNLAITLHDMYYAEVMGESIFENIRQVKPGENLTITTAGISAKQWWKTGEQVHTIPGGYDTQVRDFRKIFEESCAVRLRSDVNIATALSGGIDSAAVFCTLKNLAASGNPALQRLPVSWQRAVVASFPGTQLDEKKYAEAVVRHTNAEVNYIIPPLNNLADEITTEVTAQDFIYHSPPVVHHIYRYMHSQGIKVSLDGHGADELLFGYPADILTAVKKARALSVKKELLSVYHQMTTVPGYSNTSLFQRGIKKIKSFFETDDILYPVQYDKNYHRQFYCSNLDELQNISFRSFHIVLPTLLRNWDRASMHNGVEIRMPFMDRKLVTYTLGLPFSSRVGNGFTKRILRDSVKDILPAEIYNRKYKIGVQAPMQQWFATSLSGLINDVVNSSTFLQSAVWNGRKIQQLVQQQQKRKNWSNDACNKIWPVINAWLILNNAKT